MGSNLPAGRYNARPRGKQVMPTARERQDMIRELGRHARQGCTIAVATLITVAALQDVVAALRRIQSD